MKKSQILIRSLAFTALVGALGAAPAQAADPDAWFYQGWRQWHPHMGHYVIARAGTQYYFGPADKQLDSDGDGVLDGSDACPNTPPGVKVDAKGCPIPVAEPQQSATERGIQSADADGDGVQDATDACPSTPKGAPIGANGCWEIPPVLFGFDKSSVKKSFHAGLDGVVKVLQDNPAITLEVDGYTDSIGTTRYNQKLSKKRAVSVSSYLKNKGLASDKIHIEAFGESKPVADNTSKDGRAKNRRVEIVPSSR